MTKQSAILPANIRKILIINLAFIGDVILCTPVTRALRESYPEAVIDILTVPAATAVANLNPYINHVLSYDKKGIHRKWRNLLALIRELRNRKYDMVVCTNFAVRGAMLARAIGAPIRLGYDAQQGSLFLTHTTKAERGPDRHEAENYLDVLRSIGITAKDTSLCLKVRPEDLEYIQTLLPQSEKPIVVICPAGSYQLKSWTVKAYAELIQQLASVATVVLIGGTVETVLLEEINNQAGGQAYLFGGTLTLQQVTALISVAHLLVTVDTAPLHIAQGVGTPVIALFGPTDPAIWGPRGKDDVVFYHKVACSPCWGKNPTCDHRCMEQLQPEPVIQKAKELLRKKR